MVFIFNTSFDFVPGITGTESYHTALGLGVWNYDDDDDTLRNQSDQLSIDSFEVCKYRENH